MSRAPLWLSALTLAAGCMTAKQPLRTTLHEGDADTRTLLIMLPGFGATDRTLEKNGVIPAARAGGIRADILAVNATYPYYVGETLEARLASDVIDPNRDKYDHVWVLGISMGGLGSLLTARTFPDVIDGVVILSPFLGRRKTMTALKEQGLTRWAAPLDDPMWDEELWTHMQGWGARGWSDPPLFLGHGDRDLGMENLTWMASQLPSDRVEVTAGGHTWPVWSVLTERFAREHLAQWPAFGGEPSPPVDAPAAETPEPSEMPEPAEMDEPSEMADTAAP